MLTRRHFLRQTLGYSAAAALAAGAPSSVSDASPASAAPDRRACHLFAIGDFGVKKKDLARQRAVSEGMARYAERSGFQPDGLALLGDNFYGGLGRKGVRSPRWQDNVERMYPESAFPCPLYAVLGNHDYGDDKDRACVAAQLDYRRHVPTSRWTLPHKWYAFDLPAAEPLARVVVLDTNFVYTDKGWIDPKERKRQAKWLAAELGRPRATPWLFVLGHHPPYSNGRHGDTPGLAKFLSPLLRRHKADLYLSGHDHDLQHIEFANHPTSFVISGAGGARARKLTWGRRGVFGKSVYGFTHIELHPDRFTVRHVDPNGQHLHAFTKSRVS